MALPVNGSTHLISPYYSIYRPREDERLSWPSWLNVVTGVKLGGISPDLRSGTSCLRSITCNRPCLVCIDVASVDHYLNAIKAKQSALNARKPLVGGREPHLCSLPFGSSFGPSGLAPLGIHHLLLSNFTTERRYSGVDIVAVV